MLNLEETELPETVDDFKRVVGTIQDHRNFRAPKMWSIGFPVMTGGDKPYMASVRFPTVNGPDEHLGSLALLQAAFFPVSCSGTQTFVLDDAEKLALVKEFFKPFENDGKKHHNRDRIINAWALAGAKDGPVPHAVVTVMYDNDAPRGVEDTTLRLYGLSNRLFKPNELSFEKAFAQLPTSAWVGDKPLAEDEVEAALTAAAVGGKPYSPHMVDKFPLYCHRINALRMGVRITDQNKVRLGAYLGEGTTLMPGASYINFNAGTLGSAMVEGRISSSAYVGEGTDVGGGASMLGTLSGGNDIPISTGRNCLLEVNSALGIPIGDCCIIGANTAVMAGTPVMVWHEEHPLHGETVKASELANANGYTFRMDAGSATVMMVRTKRNEQFAKKLEDGDSILNADLH